MSIIIKPTKIKTSFYLLIPKTIVELIDLKGNTKFILKIKNDAKKTIQYVEKQGKYKQARKVKRRIIRKKTKRIKRRY